MASLKISNLTKSFGNQRILKNLDFNCNTGGVIGLFGRNGSGKSSLLKIIFGTLKADSITIILNDKTYLQKQIIPSKQIAYLPQDSFLPKSLKVRDLIPMFHHEEKYQDAIFYAPQVASFDNRKIGELSAGQLRYLEILLIGNLNHTFLLLDEPFSMIEPLYKEIIKKLILQLKKNKGILITDHYYRDVLEVTTKNFILKNGIIRAVNSREDLVISGYLSS